MARVLTNNVGLQYAIESSIGVLPASPVWRLLEPNDISAYGANITTVERRPISSTRGRKKGTVVNLESTVEFDADLTLDSFTDFAEGFVFSEFANVEFNLTHEKAGLVALDVTATGYDLATDASITTVADMTNATEVAAKMQWVTLAQATLIFAQGYAIAGNNGLKPITADVTSASTEATAAGLAVETAPSSASLQVAGIQVTDGDLTLSAPSGGVATLTSAADVADWSVLGLLPGQYIHIGSPDANGAVQNALSDAAEDDTFGYARIQSIAANVLTLDKLGAALDSAANNTGDGVADVLFGRFLRNVAVTADANDARYVERSFQFEATFPDLGGAGTDEFEYAIGNFGNELALNMPLTDKATITYGFIGTNADDIVGSGGRKAGAVTPISPLRTTAMNTSSDIVSLTTDVLTLASDVCFKSLTFTLGNNVSPENCLGTLGASFVNTDLFEVNLDAQALFTNKEMVNAVKNNTTVTFAAIIRNDNGAVAIDVPSLTFGDGSREYPVGASVLINLTGQAFNDPTGVIPNVSLGISLFATVPTA